MASMHSAEQIQPPLSIHGLGVPAFKARATSRPAQRTFSKAAGSLRFGFLVLRSAVLHIGGRKCCANCHCDDHL